ncbi:hypothetical protein ES703_121192 [subsurface metagenome]
MCPLSRIVIMKFRRQEIEQALAEQGEVLDTNFILKGKFDNGYNFGGQDFVTKIITK